MYKIMLVEDDTSLRDQVVEGLSRWGFMPSALNKFDDIFNEFIHINPNLIIMDINLPYFDGFYWCGKIREISKVPIVFLSSRDSNMDIVMAINMGGDDFITKPFSMEVLVAKLNAIIRRTYSYGDSALEVIEHKGAVLKVGQSILSYDNKEVELTKNEFRIMLMLMKGHGKIISRDKLMEALWEDESFIDDNTLTVNINRLRTKLKDIGLENFIETKKGQGYIVS